MILRLLKKLRTTRRSHRQGTSTNWTSPVSSKFEIANLSTLSHARLSSPLLRSGIAAAGLALALAPWASAQQFQTPTIPGPGPATIAHSNQSNIQNRIAHADALKAQMIRAQREQGASGEFAQKAFEAQQTYQAELALQEYTAYQKKLQLQNPQMQQASHQSPVAQESAPYKRLPKPTQQPSTFAPPVHVAPQANPSLNSFRDQPRVQSDSPIGTGTLQQVAYQEPARQQQVAYRSTAIQSQAPPQQPAPRFADQVQRTPQTQQPQPRLVQRDYILSERPPVGLQDRISSLLSSPRYQDTSETGEAAKPATRQRRVLQNYTTPDKRSNERQVVTHRSPELRGTSSQTRPPRQPLYSPQLGTLQFAPPISRAKEIPSNQNARVEKIRRDLDVQHAFETQQRMAASQQSVVQQVAMVEPAQDPFNDQSSSFPPTVQAPRIQAPKMRAPRIQNYQPPVKRPPADVLLPPATAQNFGGVGQDTMRQISILSGGNQEPAQADQFGSQFAPQEPTAQLQPRENFEPQVQDDPNADIEAFGRQSAEDLKKIDDEMNRRIQELEQERNLDPTNDDKPSVDEMVEQLENELRSEPNERESVVDDGQDRVDDEFDNDSKKPTEKTCDEFRAELLTGSIRDISLDISPLASQNRNQYEAVSRTWTDRSGNIVATGTMVDLRRGYVIIDGVNGRVKIPYAKLGDADWAAVSEYWRLPTLCSVGGSGGADRNWIPQTYTWKASSLCHKPLFFENVQLERYGHSHGPFTQPIQSFGHFFVSFFTVPYQSAITPANECQYALGFYRPGNCAPWLKDPIPFSLDGARRQALFTTGAAFIP